MFSSLVLVVVLVQHANAAAICVCPVCGTTGTFVPSNTTLAPHASSVFPSSANVSTTTAAGRVTTPLTSRPSSTVTFKPSASSTTPATQSKSTITSKPSQQKPSTSPTAPLKPVTLPTTTAKASATNTTRTSIPTSAGCYMLSLNMCFSLATSTPAPCPLGVVLPFCYLTPHSVCYDLPAGKCVERGTGSRMLCNPQGIVIC